MNRRTRPALVVLVALPLIAVLLTGAIAYRTVERVRIGSPEFDRVLLYSNVIGDTVPAPATLSDSYLLTIGLATSSDPTATAAQIALLGKAKNAYDQSINKWSGEVVKAKGADAATIKSTLDALAEPAGRFWSLAESQLVPAVKSGDGGAALALVLGPLHDAFQAHHDLGDRIATQLLAAQANQEAATRRAIEHERNADMAYAAGLAAILMLMAAIVARSGPRSRQRTDDVDTTPQAGETVETRILVGA